MKSDLLSTIKNTPYVAKHAEVDGGQLLSIEYVEGVSFGNSIEILDRYGNFASYRISGYSTWDQSLRRSVYTASEYGILYFYNINLMMGFLSGEEIDPASIQFIQLVNTIEHPGRNWRECIRDLSIKLMLFAVVDMDQVLKENDSHKGSVYCQRCGWSFNAHEIRTVVQENDCEEGHRCPIQSTFERVRCDVPPEAVWLNLFGE